MKAFQESLPILLYRVLGVVLPSFRLIFSEFGLTEQQWRVLRVLWETDALPVFALAAQTLIPAPSLVGVVDRLERIDLVRRRRSEEDRRLVCVCLTAKGSALEGEVMPRVDAAYEDLEELLDPSEWRILAKSLHRIIAGAELQGHKPDNKHTKHTAG